MKNWFNKRKRRIEELEAGMAGIEHSLQKLIDEAYKAGEHLRAEIFTPEYLGFEQVISEDEETGATTRIYSMAGYNLVRGMGKNWILMTPDNKTHQFAINNTLEAIIITNAFGYPVTLEMYLSGKIMVEHIREELKDELEELETPNDGADVSTSATVSGE